MPPEILPLQSPKLETKLRELELLVLDIDGVLTDGKIFWVPDSGWTRFFHVADGFGIITLKKLGFEVAVISQGDSKDVRERMKHLKLDHSFFGIQNKKETFDELLVKLNLKASQAAYIGDELFDIPVLEAAGFSATVPHAPEEVKAAVDYITLRPGGNGAVREIVDAIRRVKYGDRSV